MRTGLRTDIILIDQIERHHFIQELTGISDKEIVEAPPLEEVLDRMVSWLESCEATFYSWSKTDYVQRNTGE